MTPENRSLSEILHDSIGNLRDIIRSEMRLAAAEAREELNKARSASVWLGVGVVSCIYAIFFLLFAALSALALFVPIWAAALIESIALGAIALFTLSGGKTRLKTIHPIPQRAVETIKENVQWVKQRTR